MYIGWWGIKANSYLWFVHTLLQFGCDLQWTVALQKWIIICPFEATPCPSAFSQQIVTILNGSLISNAFFNHAPRLVVIYRATNFMVLILVPCRGGGCLVGLVAAPGKWTKLCREVTSTDITVVVDVSSLSWGDVKCEDVAWNDGQRTVGFVGREGRVG